MGSERQLARGYLARTCCVNLNGGGSPTRYFAARCSGLLVRVRAHFTVRGDIPGAFPVGSELRIGTPAPCTHS